MPAATSKVYLPFVSVPQASAPLPSANLLWSASMETGDLTQWNNGGGEFNSGNADTVASRDVARGGSWSAKLVATTPPESGTRLFRWHESQTYSSLYYSVWYYFPRNYSAPNYWNIFQWKSKISESIVDPFYVLNVGNRGDGSMYLYLYDWQRRNSVGSASINVPVGQWMRIEAYYKCAPDSSGAVTIWQNGTQIINHSGRSTRYSNGDCQWSVNNYSDSLSPSPATIYSDDAGISQSRIP
ncbi:MAG: heparin lyase I family protein [Chloroflexi bacterium]|nr:heparin lyase I family protein [Chloroflexota bacterium]